MSKDVDLIGQRNGRLLVVEYLGLRKRNDGRNNKVWRCVCDCGNEKIVTTNDFRYVKSCGCYRKDKNHERLYKGGRSKLYSVWSMMRRRCYDKDYKHYKNYGARGIKICDEWLGTEGYRNFRKWAENNGYAEGLTIDRIDNDKGYSPDNCEWVTMKYQSNNKRNNRRFEMDGKTKTLAMWCDEYGAEYSRTRYRIDHGYDLKTALTAKPFELRRA